MTYTSTNITIASILARYIVLSLSLFGKRASVQYSARKHPEEPESRILRGSGDFSK